MGIGRADDLWEVHSLRVGHLRLKQCMLLEGRDNRQLEETKQQRTRVPSGCSEDKASIKVSVGERRKRKSLQTARRMTGRVSPAAVLMKVGESSSRAWPPSSLSSKSQTRLKIRHSFSKQANGLWAIFRFRLLRKGR